MAEKFMLITTDQYGNRYDSRQTKKPVFFTDDCSVKGLEFDYVFIVHFDRIHYPQKQLIEELRKVSPDPASESHRQDEADILNGEKKVLYVAITRARNAVWLLYAGQQAAISPFVRDFDSKEYEAHGFRL